MKILVDIVHMADVNFFRNPIKILRSQAHEVIISVMDRNDLPKTARDEFGNVTVIGKHRKGNILIKAYSNLIRIFQLRSFIAKINPDIVTSFSYYPAASAVGKRAKSVIFHDDAEYREQFALCRIFADKFVIPDFLNHSGSNIRKFHSYKELSYLNFNHFRPSKSVLKKFDVENDKYIFIREIEPISLNYSKNKAIDYSKIIALLRKKRLKIVVSLEDASRKDEFEKCIVLQEPTKDFYSLVYHALALISSGDTMARESALIGVPSFYVGKRKMAVNRELIDKGLLIQVDTLLQLENELENLTAKKKKDAAKLARQYSKELEDTTQVIIRELLS